MSCTSPVGGTTVPEYHRYIPRFLLRNHAHPFGKRNKRKKLYADTKMLNILDLSAQEPTFTVKRVNSTFGQYDMYCDHSAHTVDQKRRVETEISQLESKVSPVFAKLLQAQAKGDQSEGDHCIGLPRADQFLLKKFIFIMKYRSPIFYNRYNHEVADDYKDKDKVEMLAYMQKKGFKRPIDVWLDNLLHILTLQTDEEVQWCHDIKELIYPQDGVWLELSIRLRYPVVCTPINPKEEFVLTGDSFCLHEGPSDFKCTTELHTICIVSPRLAILLRDDCLPELMDDRIDCRRAEKKHWLARQVKLHCRADLATSILKDLQVVKPRSTYTKGSDGKSKYSWSEPYTEYRAKTLYFPVFKIESKHVQSINSVILNEAYDLSELVYNQKPALLLALEAFITLPSEGFYSLKNYASEDSESVVHLKKLERVAHQLGSAVNAVYNVPATRTIPIEQSFDLPVDLLRSALLPHSEHTLSMSSPFIPENEGMFRSEYMRQMARTGQTPSMEDLLRLMAMYNLPGM